MYKYHRQLTSCRQLVLLSLTRSHTTSADFLLFFQLPSHHQPHYCVVLWKHYKVQPSSEKNTTRSGAHIAATSLQAAKLPQHNDISPSSATLFAQNGSCKIPWQLHKTSRIPLFCSRTNAMRLTYATGAFPDLHFALFMAVCQEWSLERPQHYRDIAAVPVAVSRAILSAQSEGGWQYRAAWRRCDKRWKQQPDFILQLCKCPCHSYVFFLLLFWFVFDG